jgi:hypothetical protein
LIAKEDLLPPIPALDDMMRLTGNNDARDAGHERSSSFLLMIRGSLGADFRLKVFMTSRAMSDSQRGGKNSGNALSVTELRIPAMSCLSPN